MEFRFRAVDERQPAHSSTHSGSSEAAMQAIFSAPTARPTLEPMQNQNHMLVQEAILREMEKEQIRKEIIALEARRELIAEVRREMAMERLAWIGQGVALPPTVNSRWLDQRVALTDSVLSTGLFSLSSSLMVQPPPIVPISEAYAAQVTPAVDPGKSKLIVLDRPDSSLSEAKRKAEEPPAVDVREPHSSVSKKKPKAEWSCALCQTTATSERGLHDHFQGRKHKDKLARLSAETPKLSKLKKPDEAKTASHPIAENAKGKGRKTVWCDICNAGTYGEAAMETHKLGRKHRKRLSELEQRDAIDTAKTTCTDLPAEVKGEDPMVGEAKAKNQTTEEATGENPVGGEADRENPMDEKATGEYPMVEDLNGKQSEEEDPTAREVNEEHPMAEEAKVEVNEENLMAEESKEEDQTVEEFMGNRPNMEETHCKDSTVEEEKEEVPTMVEAKKEL